MNKNINPIFTFNAGIATSLVAVVGSKVYETDNSNPNWPAILDAVRKDDVNKFVTAIDIKVAVQKFVAGKVQIKGSEVWYGATRLHGLVVDRIFDFMKNDLPVKPIMNFIENLMANPSSRAVNELYRFLELKNLPITSDGNFIAYKGLDSNYFSIHTGKLELISGKTNDKGQIYNGPKEVIECVRNQVDDVASNTCSYGLHAGSYKYAKDFSQGKLVKVSVNPADVITVPTDCEGQKLRTCKYEVIEDCTGPIEAAYVKTQENDGDCSGCGDCEDNCDCDADDWDYGFDAGWTDAELLGEPDVDGAIDRFSVSDPQLFEEGYNNGFDACMIEIERLESIKKPNFHNKRGPDGKFVKG